MRVHVFRPQADADRTARGLREHGFEPVVTPLFTIVPLPDTPPEGPFDALVLSSGNAIGPLAQAPEAWRELPVFTVGARTAGRAREAGFTDARSADGDRNDMIALVTGNMPTGARLLMVSGRDRNEDIAPRLEQAGFAVTDWTAYAAEAVSVLPDELKASLARGVEAAALHYSPRGAQTFLALIREAGIEEEALALTHVALSAAVAAPLVSAGASTVLVAEYPEESALFAALEQVSPPPALEAPTKVTGTEAASGSSPASAVEAKPPEPTTAPPARPDPAPVVAPVAEAQQPASILPQLLVASVLGGAIGAGIMFFALGRTPPPPPAVSEEQVTALRQRLDGLQSTTAALPDRTTLEAFEKKAETAAEAARQAGESARSAQDALKALTGRVAELASAKPAAPDPAALAGLSEEAKRAQSEASAAQSATAALAQRLASVESAAKANAEPSRQARAAVRLALTERVRGALAAGRPFAGDLNALAGAGVAAEQVAPLRPFAESGAPTGAALLQQFRAVAGKLASETAPAASGWEGRLLGIASRIVTIRPADDRAAGDPAGLPGQIEAALAKGDIAAAAQAWQRLPEPARRESAALGQALQQRAAADAALARIAQEAVTAMGTPG